jgi:hypothetical protein
MGGRTGVVAPRGVLQHRPDAVCTQRHIHVARRRIGDGPGHRLADREGAPTAAAYSRQTTGDEFPLATGRRRLEADCGSRRGPDAAARTPGSIDPESVLSLNALTSTWQPVNAQ